MEHERDKRLLNASSGSLSMCGSYTPLEDMGVSDKKLMNVSDVCDGMHGS